MQKKPHIDASMKPQTSAAATDKKKSMAFGSNPGGVNAAFAGKPHSKAQGGMATSGFNKGNASASASNPKPAVGGGPPKGTLGKSKMEHAAHAKKSPAQRPGMDAKKANNDAKNAGKKEVGGIFADLLPAGDDW